MPPLTSLGIEPDGRLEFQPQRGARLRLTNASAQQVAFKVKSTAPKNYVIKPSTGSIRRGEAAEVQIHRRQEDAEAGAGDEESAASTKAKRPDRFLVQAALVDSDEKKLLLHAAHRGKGYGAGEKKFWDGVSKDELEERQLEVAFVDGASNGYYGDEPPQDAGGKAGKDKGGKNAGSKGGAAGGGHPNQGLPSDADIDAIIGKVSLPGRAGATAAESSRGPPPGFGPAPPGFEGVKENHSDPRHPSPRDPPADHPGERHHVGLKKPTQRRHEDTVLQKHSRPVTFVAFSPTGKELYTCGKDKLVFAWTSPDGEFVRQYEGHRGAVWACSVSGDGTFLLTCGADSMVLLWEVLSGQRLSEVQLPGVARCVDWVPHGERSIAGQRYFAACSNNFKDRPAELSVWDSRDGAGEPVRLVTVKEPTLPSPATQVAWAGASCDSLCSVHPGGEVLFWSGSNGDLIGRLDAHAGPTSMVSFASDRRLMASCGRVDMVVRLWDLSIGFTTEEAVCLQSYEADRPLNAVALRPALMQSDVGSSRNVCDCLAGGGQDAREVALVGAGTDDQFDPVPLKLGEAQSLQAYAAPGQDMKGGGHFGPIHALCFSSDGAFCVSGSEDGNVRIRLLVAGASPPGAAQLGADANGHTASHPPPAALPLPQSQAKAQSRGQAKAQPKSQQPKAEPKAKPKAQPKVELATQIPTQKGAQPAKQPAAQPQAAVDGSNRLIAVYDFDPVSTGWPFGASQRPLPFSRGQEIEIIQDFGGGWAWGKVAGMQALQGLFPMNYVLPIAKYHEIMQRSLMAAQKAASPAAKPASPMLKAMSPPLKAVDPPSVQAFGAKPGSSATALLSGGLSGGLIGGLSMGGGLTGGLTGGLSGDSLASGLSGGPLTGGLTSGLEGGGLGLSGGLASDVPQKTGAEEEEEGDCSQS